MRPLVADAAPAATPIPDADSGPVGCHRPDPAPIAEAEKLTLASAATADQPASEELQIVTRVSTSGGPGMGDQCRLLLLALQRRA